ncbi:MAG: UDP-glucose 4-epimerase GalE [Pseudomonadota bacterium]
MATVLVTGGAGYIGSHACKALARAGHVPVCYDGLVTGWSDAVRFGPFEEGRLQDRDRLDAVIAAHRPGAVMHFAALSDVGEASRDPARYWENNVGGSLTLLEAMAAGGVRHMVFSSTCAVYGDAAAAAGLDEATPTGPLNAYGASKLAVEHMLRDFGMAHGLTHVAFRYFNVAGADPDGEVGEHHRPETHLIPRILEAASARGEGLTVNGDDYPTRDGTCIRDYVHVSDLVDAHVKGLDYLLAGGASTVFNLGTRDGASVREVIAAARTVTGLDIPLTVGPRRPGDAVALVSASDRAREVLGWEPVRDLSEMIATAWAWHQKGEVYRA